MVCGAGDDNVGVALGDSTGLTIGREQLVQERAPRIVIELLLLGINLVGVFGVCKDAVDAVSRINSGPVVGAR